MSTRIAGIWQTPLHVIVGCLLFCCLMVTSVGFAAAAFSAGESTGVSSDPAAGQNVASTELSGASSEQDQSAEAALEDAEAAAVTFDVDYTDADAHTSGTITYQVMTEPTDDRPGTVLLTDGTNYVAQEDSPALVLGEVTNSATGRTYRITGIGNRAFYENSSLYQLVCANSLTTLSEKASSSDTDTCCAVGPYAFYKCSNLRSITFSGGEIDGIGMCAFAHCTSLAEVNFVNGAQIAVEGIQYYAFGDCTSLASIRIPAITCAQRRGDFFDTYGSVTGRFISGYELVWHSAVFTVEKPGLGVDVFAGCTALTSVTFEAGNRFGMFAYWRTDGCGLRYLTSLESVVYEGAQPYFGNEDASMANRLYYQLWGDSVEEGETIEGADPTFYYAVDYYYTADLAASDDAAGSNRLARTEYAAGTSVSDIQGGKDAVLAESGALADPGLYVQTDAEGAPLNAKDGTVLDPNTAARDAQAAGVEGFSDADDHKWVWYLQSSESRRTGLTDSCQAYLMRADDLETARLEANHDSEDQIESMYRMCTQNLSKYGVQNTLFNPTYKYDDTYGDMFYIQIGDLQHMGTGKTPWFTLDDGGLKTLPEQMKLFYGAGNALDEEGHTLDDQGDPIDLTDESKFVITYQRYDTAVQTLIDVDVESAKVPEGPLLMTITAKEGSGFAEGTTLQEWVLVYGVTPNVLEMYGDAANEAYEDANQTTWYHALYGAGNTSLPQETFDTDNSIALCVSSGDATSTLLAAAYAGVADGSINVRSTEESYGFRVAKPGEFTPNGIISNNVDIESITRFNPASYTASQFANACYQKFFTTMSLMGVKGLSWGEAALVVNPAYVEDSVAAAAMYAYNQKAPIFYTESDGSLSDETLGCLKAFQKVIIVGDETMVPDATKKQITDDLGSEDAAVRVEGQATNESGDAESAPGNASALSLAMADYLIDEKSDVTRKNIAIVVASGMDMVADAVGVQNFSGHEDGITLVVSSSADAKSVAHYILSKKEHTPVIRLYGRNGSAANSSTFAFFSTLESIWSGDTPTIPDVDTEDLVELYGVLLSADDQHDLTQPQRVWGKSAIESGTYVGRATDGSGIAYTLGTPVPRKLDEVDKPTAAEGLVYTGSEQVGVRSLTAYRVSGGTGTDAGSYTATISLNDGYTWSDGTTDDLTISWSIAPRSIAGATVTLSKATATYVGAEINPRIVSVILPDGTKLAAGDYRVAYYRDSVSAENETNSLVDVGTYQVVVTAIGNYTGASTATYTIQSASGSDGSGGSSSSTTSSTGAAASAGKSATTATGLSSTANTDLASAVSNATAASQVPKPDADGWITFDAPGQSESAQVGIVASDVSDASDKDAVLSGALVLICLMAVAGALFFASRGPKEIDDQIPEAPRV